MPVRRERRHAAARRALQVALLDQDTARSRPRSCRAPRRWRPRGCRGRPARRRTSRSPRSSSLRSITSKPSASTSSIVERRVGDRLRRCGRRPSPRRSRARAAAAGWRCAACRASAARSRARPSSSIGTSSRPRRAAARCCVSSSARVELEPRDDAEAVAQRVGEHAGARGRADQREGRQVELDRARRRPLADHDVDLVVLQRRIEDLLDHRREAVDLVDEQHVVAARGWSGAPPGRRGAPAPARRSGAGSRPARAR